MSVDKETVRRMAFLSRLKVEDENIENVQHEFDGILDWMGVLSEVDVNGIEPLVSVNDKNLKCREDKVTDGNKAEEVLKNAPVSEYGYFVVPKVVE